MLKTSMTVRRTWKYSIGSKYLGVGELTVTPSSIDHVPLGHDFDLSLVIREAHKAEAFGVSSLRVSLHLQREELHVSGFSVSRTCRI